MNPRRIHALMSERFPAVEHADRDWLVVQTADGANANAIAALLNEHIASLEVLIEVHRKLGSILPIDEAPAYIGRHIGQGEIRVAYRDFKGFVVVARNGVASGWKNAG